MPPARTAARAALGEEGRRGRLAYERATLYGLVVCSQRRMSYGKVSHGRREIFIRERWLRRTQDSRLPFLAANRRVIAQVEARASSRRA